MSTEPDLLHGFTFFLGGEAVATLDIPPVSIPSSRFNTPESDAIASSFSLASPSPLPPSFTFSGPFSRSRFVPFRVGLCCGGLKLGGTVVNGLSFSDVDSASMPLPCLDSCRPRLITRDIVRGFILGVAGASAGGVTGVESFSSDMSTSNSNSSSFLHSCISMKTLSLSRYPSWTSPKNLSHGATEHIVTSVINKYLPRFTGVHPELEFAKRARKSDRDIVFIRVHAHYLPDHVSIASFTKDCFNAYS